MGKPFYKNIWVVLCKKTKYSRYSANILELRPFLKLVKLPLSKGYSLCIMVSLTQKLKMPKTCEKRLYLHVIVVLYLIRLEKIYYSRKKNYSRNETILKIGKNGH